MIKILVLEQLRHLADDTLKYELLDESSFLHFLDLTGSSSLPDAKTIWLSRNLRLQAGIGKQFFFWKYSSDYLARAT